MNIYSWHERNWANLFIDTKRFPHGLILYGPRDSGINNFASIAGKRLICSNSNKTERYCGICQNCSWFDSQSHPDFISVNNDSLDEKNIIKIDSIRNLKDFFELSSHQKNGKKVAVIYDAHQMNLAASNALLKILEEPPNDSVIILTTSNLSSLLPTIKSRSRLESFSKPSYEDATNFLKTINKDHQYPFLQFYNSNPLALINDCENHPLLIEIISSLKLGKKFDLSDIDGRWFSNGLIWLINLLQKWSYDILLSKLVNQQYYFPNEELTINQLARSSNTSALLKFQKMLVDVKLYATSPVNKEINLDIIFIYYRKIFI
jgi:DNA polymerase III subunit delta'